MSASLSVAVVDDCDFDRYATTSILVKAGYRVFDFDDARTFLSLVETMSIGCIVADWKMPSMEGTSLLRFITASDQAIPMILVSGVATVAIATEAMRYGAIDVLEKPVNPEALVESVERGFDISRRGLEKRKLAKTIAAELESLTAKEREVLPFVCSGLSLKEIASEFEFGFATAARHQSRILDKLGCDNPLQLARKLQKADMDCQHMALAQPSLC